MFNPSRWRTEKTKIEALFKFHFHATQIPKLGLEAMMVTLVPVEGRPPTVRLEKVAILNGACYWEEPIYESVLLSQNSRTGKMDEKVYQFRVSAVISMEFRVLGEITIDLSDYAEAFKPSSVSFPLKASKTGAILHVTLQRMPVDVGRRYADGNGDMVVRKQRKTLQSQLSNCDNEGGGKELNAATNDIISTEIGSLIIAKEEEATFASNQHISLRAESSDNLKKSSSFDTLSTSSSDTNLGLLPQRGTGVKKDSLSLFIPRSNSDTLRNPVDNSSDLITDTNCSVDSVSNGNIGEPKNISEEAGSIEWLQEPDGSPEKLKIDVALKKQRHISELELQTLRKQVVKERRRGEKLLNQLSSLKVERDASRKECETFKSLLKRRNGEENVPNNLQLGGEDPWTMLEEIKEELNTERNLNAKLSLQLQKTQEANTELVLALRDLECLLEQKNCEISCISCSTGKPKTNTMFKETENELHWQYSNSKHEPFKTYSKNDDQYSLGIVAVDSAKDSEDIEMQMEQLALDYEILKQENHYMSSKLEQTELREQLMTQYECSAHLVMINDLEAHVEDLEKELQKQVEAFEADLEIIANTKVEQEKRAIQSEEALRKTRLNNANTAEHLQLEFNALSAQMSSTFHANEMLLMQALAESSELCSQKNHLEELLEKSNRELRLVKAQCHVKFQQLLSLIDFKTKEADRLFMELKETQKQLERHKASLEEMILHRAEMETLSADENHLSEEMQHNGKLLEEMEEMKRLMEESDTSLQERNMEMNLLQIELASVKEEANKSVVELSYLRHLIDEHNIMTRSPNSEVRSLRMQHFDLKDYLHKDETEKETLKQQISELMRDIQNNEDIQNTGKKSSIGSDSHSTLEFFSPKTRISKYSSNLRSNTEKEKESLPYCASYQQKIDEKIET